MPNFTGVTASARLACSWAAFQAVMALAPGPDVRAGEQLVPAAGGALGVPHLHPVGRALAGCVEVAAAQLEGVEPEEGGGTPEDVLDDQHPLRPAEAAERGLGGGVRQA